MEIPNGIGMVLHGHFTMTKIEQLELRVRRIELIHKSEHLEKELDIIIQSKVPPVYSNLPDGIEVRDYQHEAMESIVKKQFNIRQEQDKIDLALKE